MIVAPLPVLTVSNAACPIAVPRTVSGAIAGTVPGAKGGGG